MTAQARAVAPAYGSAWLSGQPGQPRPAGAGVLYLVALPTAPFWARRYTRRFLDGHRDITEETTRTAELVVSELVTNSVRFSGGHERMLPQRQPYSGRADAPLISLSLRYFHDGLLIEVYDTSTDPPVPACACGDAENGRGLMLVGALTKEWSYFLLPDGGKVVYCFLEIS
jgi:anti-sigma regulatory factor (Ser/Thr protein kinase)